MVSLVDLLGAAEHAETVTVLGQEVECRALSIGDIARLMLRFPEVRKLMADRQVEPEQLFAIAPTAAAAVIALGTGHGDDPNEVAAAEKLPPGVQIMLVTTILRLSAPDGLVPLLQAASRLMGVALVGPGRAPDGSSPSPSSG